MVTVGLVTDALSVPRETTEAEPRRIAPLDAYSGHALATDTRPAERRLGPV
ncbi:hypothetical protein HMPREF1980_01832 [Actinomyces sp. oral taxon 172 str. F0311]|nr:hypothetical protein HMPREF1980_01832 [Actinomyces sp. oral taxon 172 str. F0311]